MSSIRIAVATACLAVVASPLTAQTTVATTYRSAFEGFRPFAEQPVGPWREANDTVGRLGGWRAYAREAQGEAARDGGHAGHGGKRVPHVEHGDAARPGGSRTGASPAPAGGHAGHSR